MWRFRTNWRGKLVLQRGWTVHYYMHLKPTAHWRDANATDLLDYAKELLKTS